MLAQTKAWAIFRARERAEHGLSRASLDQFDPHAVGPFDEGDAYAARLASLGVAVSHVRFSGQFHGFVSLADFVDDGKAALSLSASMLRSAFNPPIL